MRLAAAGLAVVALAACGGDNEEAASDVADITCSNTTLTVTPRVRTHTHGVHVEANVSDEPGVTLTIDGRDVRGGVVMRLSPGSHRVVCRHGDGGSMESSFEVIPSQRQVQP